MKKIPLIFAIFSGILIMSAGWVSTTSFAANDPGTVQIAQASAKKVQIVSDSAAGTSATSESSLLRVGAAKVKIEFPDSFFPYTVCDP